MPPRLGTAAASSRLIVRLHRPSRAPSAGASRRRVFVTGLVCGVVLVFLARLLINETSIADVLISPLLQADTGGRADAIVVLGAGVVGDCVPNQNAVRRVLLAARLWRLRRAPLVVFTGGQGEGPCPIAVAMSRMAVEVGIAEAVMRLETTSRTTWDNAVHSAPMLRQLGCKKLLLVTDTLHMPRASGVFLRQGFEIERASVPIYESHPDNVSMLVAGAREVLGLAYYRTRGWIGHGS